MIKAQAIVPCAKSAAACADLAATIQQNRPMRAFLFLLSSHAGAARVHVETHVESATLELVVADDGRGTAALKPGNGLANSKRRAELVGGTFAPVPGDRASTCDCVLIGE